MGEVNANPYFWFDPFGSAPPGACVSGQAGGFISWGGRPGWPFEWQSELLPPIVIRRPRYPLPYFQLRTDIDPDAPPTDEPISIEFKRGYVIKPLEAEQTDG